MTGARTIAIVPKNRREEIRVDLDKYMNRDLVSARVWAPVGPDARPTTKGLSLAVEKLPELIRALQAAEVEARQLGLLPPGGVT